MRYTIEYKPAATRQLRALPTEIRSRVQDAIEALADNPWPPRVKKMEGRENRWRIPIGDYRVVYEIRSHVLLVLIVAVGHRREIYRLLR
jgi:mRNA interferase RelE/StbE